MIQKLRSWLGGGRQTPREVPPDNGSTRYVEQLAKRMIKLVTSREGVPGNLPEIRAIGQRLHDRSGTDRMRDLLFEVGETHGRPDLEPTIARAWDGVGDWRS
ncbi:hypothetical protein [Streptomyces sp. NPDC093544]|uniref:hypothetical protein n=1 Tax=Streptomyces sp. NPDC093544 TaxID=3155200 RepID=UPI0034402B1B